MRGVRFGFSHVVSSGNEAVLAAADYLEYLVEDPNALLGEVEATLGKQLLDIAIAQGEAKVQPLGVLDDDRRKTMPAIGDRHHARSLRRTSPIQQVVFLTMPAGPLWLR
jgi:hypothetical protein